MSQASKQVDWCLNKANREIEECKKQGKRPRHRGLLKGDPNADEARKHIEKAVHNLKAVKHCQKQFSDWSVTAGFYCIYHCFLAIIAKFGYESGNQTCTVALIEYLNETKKITINPKVIQMLKYEDESKSVIDLREDYTYGVKVSVDDKTTIKDLIKICEETVDISKNIVFS